eukprot:6180376-Pleurochrysis_carterae.AAC.1
MARACQARAVGAQNSAQGRHLRSDYAVALAGVTPWRVLVSGCMVAARLLYPIEEERVNTPRADDVIARTALVSPSDKAVDSRTEARAACCRPVSRTPIRATYQSFSFSTDTRAAVSLALKYSVLFFLPSSPSPLRYLSLPHPLLTGVLATGTGWPLLALFVSNSPIWVRVAVGTIRMMQSPRSAAATHRSHRA